MTGSRRSGLGSGAGRLVIARSLIYAEIQQGSRTTINDELKRWKDEQARAEALDADLPPVVADSMRSLWVLAVEQGERAFDQRRGELESELATARQELADTKAAHQALQASSDLAAQQLRERITTSEQQLTEVRHQLASETATKSAALEHAHALREELSAVRRDSAQQVESVRQEQARQAAEYHQAITTRDVTFRVELATVTQRLESAQTQMLQQIDDARQAQRRAESEAAQIQHQRQQLQSELVEVKLQSGVQAHELQQKSAVLEKATEATTRWAAERQTLTTELASARGRSEGLEQTVRSLEARAAAAEARLAEALTRGSGQSGPRTGRRSKTPSND